MCQHTSSLPGRRAGGDSDDIGDSPIAAAFAAALAAAAAAGPPTVGHKGHSQDTAEATIPPAAVDSPAAHLQHRAQRQEPQAHQERLGHQGHQGHQELQELQELQERQECQRCQEHRHLQEVRWEKSDRTAVKVERLGLFFRASISELWPRKWSIHSHFQERPK